jgi:hypothetical protein
VKAFKTSDATIPEISTDDFSNLILGRIFDQNLK